MPGSDVPCASFYDACMQRGLLEDDGEWRLCFAEASQMQTGAQLRHLFVTILLFGPPSRPQDLWAEFSGQICSDLSFRIQQMGLIPLADITDEVASDYGLYLLDKLLRDANHDLSEWPQMPQPTRNWTGMAENRNPWLAEARAFSQDQQLETLTTNLALMNDGQLTAYTTIVESISLDQGRLFFLNGSAGTGKTFVYKTVCAKVRSEGGVVVAVSSSGISALLIPGGRTAHSVFSIPISDLDEFSTCRINKTSDKAALFKEAKVIIWDEVGAQHRHALQAVDRTLRDIRNCDQPFGGVTTVLGGDFLQTLPVVPGGSREEIVDACVQRSYLWRDVHVLSLHENMRLLNAHDAGTSAFLEWLSDVGHGVGILDSGDSSQVRVYSVLI